ncbi:MAG: DnaJ domain-containing protein [Candidatus Pseudobacter hemicellulosilyticus]|uniref:DnaJ domain-containing protein n=1 Tax=Candidatus Pseudobacter hemicellulosilyticus TaxID=3121375 RepID=A0AAJ5WWM3_9BACT|nr:MAG: DnaJ domain-containing protein [Pseudobacter sp.]
MEIKDYYTILEVRPTASGKDIKTSFRRLALKYHPDTNNGNALSEALFREVQEAYAVLSDPQQREEYNYKRWYNRSIGEGFREQVVTPAALAAESQKLQQYVGNMNIFQVDYASLSYHIRQLLTESNLAILREGKELPVNRQIIRSLLMAAAPLPLPYAVPVAGLLEQLAADDATTLREIRHFLQEKKAHANWDKYKWVVVLSVTALLCLLIFLVGR